MGIQFSENAVLISDPETIRNLQTELQTPPLHLRDGGGGTTERSDLAASPLNDLDGDAQADVLSLLIETSPSSSKPNLWVDCRIYYGDGSGNNQVIQRSFTGAAADKIEAARLIDINHDGTRDLVFTLHDRDSSQQSLLVFYGQQPEKPGIRAGSVLALTGLALGLASAVPLTFTILAANENAENADLYASTGKTSYAERANNAHDDALLFGILTGSMGAVGLGLSIAGLFMNSSDEKKNQAPRLSALPVINPNGAGFMVTGTF